MGAGVPRGITHGGETRTLAQWVALRGAPGVTTDVAWRRLNSGWGLARALAEPVRSYTVERLDARERKE